MLHVLVSLSSALSMVQPDPLSRETSQAGPAIAAQPWRNRVLVSQAVYAIVECTLLRLHQSEHASCPMSLLPSQVKLLCG